MSIDIEHDVCDCSSRRGPFKGERDPFGIASPGDMQSKGTGNLGQAGERRVGVGQSSVSTRSAFPVRDRA
jgi:hypothetical protein